MEGKEMKKCSKCGVEKKVTDSKANTQCLCRQCNIEKYSTGAGDQLRLFG